MRSPVALAYLLLLVANAIQSTAYTVDVQIDGSSILTPLPHFWASTGFW